MSGKELSRREFLRGGSLALGGLVAACALPSVAEDNPALFPKRGRFERLSITCHHIKAGAEKPFSLLHISDTHLTAAYPREGEAQLKLSAERSLTFGGRQEEALRDSLAWAKQHVDYVLHTGDLIDWQSEANFDLVRKYYGDAPGTVTAEQATSCDAEIKKGLPTILCMHVPFNTPHIWRAATKFWAKNNLFTIPDASKYQCKMSDPTTRDFLAYLKSQPLLKGVLAGHLHIDVIDRISPTAKEYVVGGNFLFHGAEIIFT